MNPGGGRLSCPPSEGLRRNPWEMFSVCVPSAGKGSGGTRPRLPGLEGWRERYLMQTQLCILVPGLPTLPCPYFGMCLVQDAAKRRHLWGGVSSRAATPAQTAPSPSVHGPTSPARGSPDGGRLGSENRGCVSAAQGPPGRHGQQWGSVGAAPSALAEEPCRPSSCTPWSPQGGAESQRSVCWL